MNRTILIASIALLASTAAAAQAERGERDPDKMAVIAATIHLTQLRSIKKNIRIPFGLFKDIDPCLGIF
jgi:hypothetical protein